MDAHFCEMNDEMIEGEACITVLYVTAIDSLQLSYIRPKPVNSARRVWDRIP